MNFMWYALCFIASYKFRIILADPLQIQIDSGLVHGRQLKNSLYAWSGIPFAKPPTGNLRFETPQPPDSWEGVWDARWERSKCVQTSIDEYLLPASHSMGDEDCLYINVYTPQLPSTIVTPIPVMVWIYGGGFTVGDGNYATYGPDQLVAENVTVVTFNYRVGIFGFAFTDDNVVPGNLGIKDQILALQWVQRNIAAFGGDKNLVTIFGSSAGAASTSYLVASPLGSDLFHRAIMQSGNTICLWSLSKLAKKATFKVGQLLGIFTISSRYLIDQLKTVLATKLQNAAVTATNAYLFADPINGLVFAPVIEPADTINAVITTSTYESLRLGYFNRVPLLMGYNSFEAVSLEFMIEMWYFYLIRSEIFPSLLVPDSMNANVIGKLLAGPQIKYHYGGILGSVLFPEENFLKYLSDNEFVRPIQKMARFTSHYTRTYFYKFSYTQNPEAAGAGHGEELLYLFNSRYNSTFDMITKYRLVKLWTNFAKTGNPTPSYDPILESCIWLEVTPNVLNYLDIDNNLTIKQNPSQQDMDFWNNLFSAYSNPPLFTY